MFSTLITGIAFIGFKYNGSSVFLPVGIVYILKTIYLFHIVFNNSPPVPPDYDVILSTSFFDIAIALLLVTNIIFFKRFKRPENELSHELLYNILQDAVFIIYDGMILNCNKAAENMFGYRRNDIIGKNTLFLSTEYQPNGQKTAERLQQCIKRTIAGEEYFMEWLHKRADGSEFLGEVFVNLYPESDGRKVITTVRDLTSRKNAEDIARLTSIAFENSFDGVFVINPTGKYEFVNNSFSEMTGYTVKELLGMREQRLRANIPDGTIYEKIIREMQKKGKWSGEIWNKKKNGALYLTKTNVAILKNINGDMEKIIGTSIDVTDYYRKKEQLQYFHDFDRLTGLMNKEHFIKALTDDISKNDTEIVLFDIDINNFKYINDTFGFLKGDDLLLDFSVRFKKIIKRKMLMCRYAVDEFIIYCSDSDQLPVSSMVESIFETLKKPFIINNEEVFVTVSVGIISTGSKTFTANNLINNVSIALQDAKKKGSNQISFFDQSLQNKAVTRLKLENELRSAIFSNALTPFFQAKVDSATEKTIGMETLVRWIKNDNEIISPVEFLSMAERTGLIYPMTEKLMEAAALWTTKWNNENTDNLRVAINLSAKHFKNYNLISAIDKLLESTLINVSNLELEITESAFLNNSDEVFQIFKEIKDKGIHISLDDFGTGYSSFSYLKRIPLDSLKIDKTFIDDIEHNEQSRKLLKSIFDIAKNLNLKTVAEGVENIRQKEILQDLNCDILQGYFYSPPITPDDFAIFLNKNKTNQ